MRYLLDTNAVIAVLNRNDTFIQTMTQHAPTDIGVSAVSWFELQYGAHKSQRSTENLTRLGKLRFEILPFDASAADMAGRIRADLERRGLPIGGFDTLIAGHALSRGLTLITHNLREFRRVEGLSAESWQ